MLQQKKIRNSLWKKMLASAVLFFALCLQGFSQVLVSGTVRDHDSGKPMAGAHITVENTFISVASANDGKYQIRVQKADNWTLKAFFHGVPANRKDLPFSTRYDHGF